MYMELKMFFRKRGNIFFKKLGVFFLGTTFLGDIKNAHRDSAYLNFKKGKVLLSP